MSREQSNAEVSNGGTNNDALPQSSTQSQIIQQSLSDPLQHLSIDDTFSGKKQILKDALKIAYKKQYDAIQPIPYIKDKLYCVDNIFVEVGAHKPTVNRSQWKRLESYKSIFNDEDLMSKRLIVEGEPGYGKSTLTLQLAYDWCNDVEDNPLSKVDILILLRLRQLGHVTSIYQAIKRCLLQDEGRIKTSDIKAILETSTNVAFLLDSYDEYPHRNNDANSDVGRIIRSEMLKQCDVILTTRYLPKEFDKSQTKQVKLSGFDEEARDQYIRKAVIKGNDIKEFDQIKQAVDENPILDDLCQVPLFFVMFAHMSHDRKDFHKFKNVTDFFRYMMRCIEEHAKNKTTQFETIFQAEYGKLSKVAWNGLNQDSQQLVWGKDDLCLQLGKPFYDHYISVGILVEEEVVSAASTEEGNISTKIEVRFYHKIFCEWYASFTLTEVALKARDNNELKKVLKKLDPFDLQYVYRFACGLNLKAGSIIIKYLKSRIDGDKFAILCILEQAGEVEDNKETIRKLCSERILIRHDDSKLLKRSSVQLLEMASRYDISVFNLNLAWCFNKIDGGKLILDSGLSIPRLSLLERISITANQLSENEVADLLNYGQQSQTFTELWFLNCKPPNSIRPEVIPEASKTRKITVVWPSNASVLNLDSGEWEKAGADDTNKLRILCSMAVFLRNADHLSIQYSTIELLKNATRHEVTIEVVILAESFSKVYKGSVILTSGLTLPPLNSVKDIWIGTKKGGELTETEVNEILEYCQRSPRFRYLGFYWCLLLPLITLETRILSDKAIQDKKVLWFPFGPSGIRYKLRLQEDAHWLDIDDTELSAAEYEKQRRSFHKRWGDQAMNTGEPGKNTAECEANGENLK